MTGRRGGAARSVLGSSAESRHSETPVHAALATARPSSRGYGCFAAVPVLNVARTAPERQCASAADLLPPPADLLPALAAVPEAAQPKKKGRKKGSGKKKGMDSSDAAKKLERMPKIYEEFAHLMPPKDTRKKTHVHMCCALFVTDITFNNPDAMSDLSLSQMTPARMDLKCVVCGQAGGGTMQCAVGNCYKGFHVLCGRARSFTMGFRATDGHPLGFCREHSGPRYRRVRESMLNGRKLMAAEVRRRRSLRDPRLLCLSICRTSGGTPFVEHLPTWRTYAGSCW